MKSRTEPQRAVRSSHSEPQAGEGEQQAPEVDEFGPRPQQRFGAVRMKLQVEEIPGFNQRWIKDLPGRVEFAEECGYAHVKDKQGKPITRIADKAGARLYLMKIPQHWFDENKAEELEEQVNSVERDIFRGKSGSMTPGHDGAYVPTDGRGGPSRINVREVVGHNQFKR